MTPDERMKRIISPVNPRAWDDWPLALPADSREPANSTKAFTCFKKTIDKPNLVSFNVIFYYLSGHKSNISLSTTNDRCQEGQSIKPTCIFYFK